jgi:hypothetical protein
MNEIDLLLSMAHLVNQNRLLQANLQAAHQRVQELSADLAKASPPNPTTPPSPDAGGGSVE